MCFPRSVYSNRFGIIKSIIWNVIKLYSCFSHRWHHHARIQHHHCGHRPLHFLLYSYYYCHRCFHYHPCKILSLVYATLFSLNIHSKIWIWTQRPSRKLRACLRGGGGPQVGEVTRLAETEKLNAFICNLTAPGCWGVLALAMKEFEQRRPKLTSRKGRRINSRTHMYLFMT